MKNEFTAIIEKEGDWYVSYCAEIPGANGQGKTNGCPVNNNTFVSFRFRWQSPHLKGFF